MKAAKLYSYAEAELLKAKARLDVWLLLNLPALESCLEKARKDVASWQRVVDYENEGETRHEP